MCSAGTLIVFVVCWLKMYSSMRHVLLFFGSTPYGMGTRSSGAPSGALVERASARRVSQTSARRARRKRRRQRADDGDGADSRHARRRDTYLFFVRTVQLYRL